MTKLDHESRIQTETEVLKFEKRKIVCGICYNGMAKVNDLMNKDERTIVNVQNVSLMQNQSKFMSPPIPTSISAIPGLSDQYGLQSV